MTATVEVERTLTAEDRCDSCTAAAQVVFTFESGSLYFCGHHAKKNKDVLLDKSLSVWDPNNIIF
jgi:hypothetical protein